MQPLLVARPASRYKERMTQPLRKFGVDDADVYWQRRRDASDTGEKRIHRFLAALTTELLPQRGRVLDCGVGPGHTFRLCSQRHETYGVEISAKAIELYDFPTTTIKQADLTRGIPDFGVAFDVIIASMILHWFDRPWEYLASARQRLAPSGKLIVVIPNITNYHFRIGFLFGKFPPISPSHKNFQTPAEFEAMVAEHGWRIERRATPKKTLRARWWPTLFSQDIVYVLSPED